VTAYLGRDVRWTIPNDQELATETINRGVPMVISHRRRPLAQRYRALARELLDDRRQAHAPAAGQQAEAFAAAGHPVALAAAADTRTASPDGSLGVAGVQELEGPSSAAERPAAVVPASKAAKPNQAPRPNALKDRPYSPRPAPRLQDLAFRVLAGVGGLALLGGLVYTVLQLFH
jgi:hypothetical protein